MKLYINEQTSTGMLTEVLYVPDLCKNLFSIGCAISKGLNIHFHHNMATLYNGNHPVMTATKQGNLYFINGTTIQATATLSINSTQELNLWHRCLGHIGMNNLQHMIKSN